MQRRPTNQRQKPSKRPAPSKRPTRAAGPVTSAATQTADPRERVHGLRAVLAVLRVRPDAILRVAYTPEARGALDELRHFAASRSIACAQVSDAELARMAEATQHEGVCIETRPRRWQSPQALAEHLAQSQGAAVAFDRVRNPYNIGAILRSAAFFGVEGAILGMPAPHPALSAQAVRVAEGGAEHLMLSRTTDLADTLSRLRAQGIRIVGAEDDGKHKAFGYRFNRPCILVLGHEREGLSPKVRAQCDVMIAIPGTGPVHSLNVSVAASILIAELQRERL